MVNEEIASFLVDVIKATINLSRDVVFTNAFLTISLSIIGGLFVFTLVKKAIGIVKS